MSKYSSVGPYDVTFWRQGRYPSLYSLLVSLSPFLHDPVIDWLGWELLAGAEDMHLVEADEILRDDLEVREVTQRLSLSRFSSCSST